MPEGKLHLFIYISKELYFILVLVEHFLGEFFEGVTSDYVEEDEEQVLVV